MSTAAACTCLAAPADPLQSEHVGPRHVDAILELLRDDNELVVADIGKRWDPLSLRALQSADLILLAMSVDLPTLAATARTLALLEGLEIPRERIRLVANRFDKEQKQLERDAETFLGTPVDFHLPNDYANVTACITAGDTLHTAAPNSPLTRAFADLAGQVHTWLGIQAPSNDDSSPARLSRVRGWFTKGNA